MEVVRHMMPWMIVATWERCPQWVNDNNGYIWFMIIMIEEGCKENEITFISTAERCSYKRCLQRFPTHPIQPSTYSFWAFKPVYKSNEQQWATMDNNGKQWTTMDSNGQRWTKMDNNGATFTATCTSDAVFIYTIQAMRAMSTNPRRDVWFVWLLSFSATLSSSDSFSASNFLSSFFCLWLRTWL